MLSRTLVSLARIRISSDTECNNCTRFSWAAFSSSIIIVKKGTENISLKLEDVVLFYTENKIVYVIDRSGKKYLADKNLSLLEQELDNSVYFRANRQYIININYVRGFKSFEKVKLQVDLTMPDLNHSIIVSQEMAPVFREWMLNA